MKQTTIMHRLQDEERKVKYLIKKIYQCEESCRFDLKAQYVNELKTVKENIKKLNKEME